MIYQEVYTMLPDPLHPAIVHFPVALAFILPVMILLALALLRKGASTSMAWFPVLALATMVFFGTLIAKNTGEEEEDAVEEVVSRRAIHDHEENADLFGILAGIMLATTVAAFLPSKWGRMARYATLAMSLAVAFSAYQSGRSGGELVYKLGAASAYTEVVPEETEVVPEESVSLSVGNEIQKADSDDDADEHEDGQDE